MYEQPLFQKARWWCLPAPLCLSGGLLWPEGRQHGGDLSPFPLWSFLRKTTCGPDRVWQHTICSPSLQTWLWKEDPREGNHIQPEAGKCFPRSAAAAGVGLLPSHPQQDGMNEGKQNSSQCKGFLGFLMRTIQEPRAGATEEPPGEGGGREDPVGKLAGSRDLLTSTESYGNKGQTMWRVASCFTCVYARAHLRVHVFCLLQPPP